MQETHTDDAVATITRLRRARLAVAAAVIVGSSILSIGVSWAEGCACG